MAAVKFCRMSMDGFNFDDGFMFYRYAMNFRHGYGIAWNAGGPHVFGLTSLPWFLVVLAGSYLVRDPLHLLVLSSCITGVIALFTMAWSASRHARSAWMRSLWVQFPLLAVPLLLDSRFGVSWANGMETMLGLLVMAVFVDQSWEFRLRPTAGRSVLLALLGALCAITRPEALLCAVLLPTVLWYLLSSRKDVRPLALYLGTLFLLVAADLFFNWRYFGTPVPLAFYLKSLHGYDGYRLYLNPFGYTATFFGIAVLPMLTLAGCAQRTHGRTLAAFLLPLGAEVLYLLTVTQIMGWQARYYVPFLPLLYFPAIMIADEAICAGGVPRWSTVRVVTFLAVLLTCGVYVSRVTTLLGRFVAKRRLIYLTPKFFPDPEPEIVTTDWTIPWHAIVNMTAKLPQGTKMEASEVGLLGAAAPQVTLIDSVGLNDAYMARHPLGIDYLFAQDPDLIWLPHPDYTRLYGTFASDPRLLRDYEFYAEAAEWGMAIRKASPRYAEVKRQFAAYWKQQYPGYEMDKYRVTRVSWDPKKIVRASSDDMLQF